MESQSKKLYLAIRHKNIELIESLLKQGVDPNILNDYNETPLHYAIQKYSQLDHKLPNVVEMLISYGANINIPMHNNVSPFGVAMLKSYDADINIPNHNNVSPLYVAIIYNLPIIVVEMLISHGADINERFDYGNTLLHIAVIYNLPNMVEILINQKKYITF